MIWIIYYKINDKNWKIAGGSWSSIGVSSDHSVKNTRKKHIFETRKTKIKEYLSIYCIIKLTVDSMQCRRDTVHGSQYSLNEHHYQTPEPDDFHHWGQKIRCDFFSHPSSTICLLNSRNGGNVYIYYIWCVKKLKYNSTARCFAIFTCKINSKSIRPSDICCCNIAFRCSVHISSTYFSYISKFCPKQVSKNSVLFFMLQNVNISFSFTKQFIVSDML